MFYKLKDDALVLKLKEESIFLKNSFGDVIISVPNSYNLFNKIKPFLNGKYDMDVILSKIKSEKLAFFYSQLINTLEKKHFLLFSINPIDIDNIDSFTLKYLEYIDNLDAITLIGHRFLRVSANSEKVFTIVNELKPKNFSLVTDKTNVCSIKISVENNVWFISKNNNKIYLTSKPNVNYQDSLTDLPILILRLCISVVFVELGRHICKINNQKNFKDSYIFDLDRFTLN